MGGSSVAPRGGGKSHLIASLIRAFPHSELCARNTPLAVVTVGEQDIAYQNYELLKKQLPDRDVGLVMSGSDRVSDDVQVITLGSLHHIKMSEVGILVVDEVHTAGTDKRAGLLLQAKKARTWGCSATPSGRFDNADLLLEGLCGPVVYKRTYKQGVDDGALVPIVVYWINVPQPTIGLEAYHRYKTRLGMYRHGVECNDGQNAIVATLMQRIPDNMQTLCIMQHTNQLNQLAPLLPNVQYVHAKQSVDELAKARQNNLAAISAKERRRIYEDMNSGKLRKVMSTYVYKQGVNFPELQIMICPGGGGSEIVAGQIPGRGSRNIAGKDVAYLIDFYHHWDTTTNERGKARPGPILSDDHARDKVYEELGFERHWIEDVNTLPFLQGIT